MAKQFFMKLAPEYAKTDWICSSWLLAPVLRNLLPKESRILLFQDFFEIMEVQEDSRDYLEWVYQLKVEDEEQVDFHQLPETTSLQKKMKQYLLKGGLVGTALAKLKNDINE